MDWIGLEWMGLIDWDLDGSASSLPDMSSLHLDHRIRAQHLCRCVSDPSLVGLPDSRDDNYQRSVRSRGDILLLVDHRVVPDTSLEVELSSIECRMAAVSSPRRHGRHRSRRVGRMGHGVVRQVRRQEQRLHLDRMLVLALVLVLGRRLARDLWIIFGDVVVQLGGGRHLAIDQRREDQASDLDASDIVPCGRDGAAVLVHGGSRDGRRAQSIWRIWSVFRVSDEGMSLLSLNLSVSQSVSLSLSLSLCVPAPCIAIAFFLPTFLHTPMESSVCMFLSGPCEYSCSQSSIHSVMFSRTRLINIHPSHIRSSSSSSRRRSILILYLVALALASSVVFGSLALACLCGDSLCNRSCQREIDRQAEDSRLLAGLQCVLL